MRERVLWPQLIADGECPLRRLSRWIDARGSTVPPADLAYVRRRWRCRSSGTLAGTIEAWTSSDPMLSAV